MQCKLYTKACKGKFVRFLLLIIVLTTIFESCQKDLGLTDERETVEGTWKCQEVVNNKDTYSYYVQISKAADDSTKVYLYNFFQIGMNYKVYAYLNGTSLTIPKQTTDNIQFSGNGTISSGNNTIKWTYSANDGSGTDNVTATYTKSE
jgi:hypothetical protein